MTVTGGSFAGEAEMRKSGEPSRTPPRTKHSHGQGATHTTRRDGEEQHMTRWICRAQTLSIRYLQRESSREVQAQSGRSAYSHIVILLGNMRLCPTFADMSVALRQHTHNKISIQALAVF